MTPTEQRSTAGHAVMHCGGDMLCQSEAQLITALSSAEAEVVAAVTKPRTLNAQSLCLQNWESKNQRPPPRVRTTNQWKWDQHFTLLQMPGVTNLADDLTKSHPHVSHSRHAGCVLGHRPMVKT